jgi:hypothetical protein
MTQQCPQHMRHLWSWLVGGPSGSSLHSHARLKHPHHPTQAAPGVAHHTNAATRCCCCCTRHVVQATAACTLQHITLFKLPQPPDAASAHPASSLRQAHGYVYSSKRTRACKRSKARTHTHTDTRAAPSTAQLMAAHPQTPPKLLPWNAQVVLRAQKPGNREKPGGTSASHSRAEAGSTLRPQHC